MIKTDTDAAALHHMITTAIHDGIYRLDGVLWMHTRFCVALWDTLSVLYSGLHLLTNHSDTTT